jgi:hypothetical protein
MTEHACFTRHRNFARPLLYSKRSLGFVLDHSERYEVRGVWA